MDKFISKLNDLKTVSDDEVIARKIVNLCTSDIRFCNIDIIFEAKAKHFCLAYKILKQNYNAIQNMILFEYLKDNILNIQDYEDEDDIYV